VTPEARDRRAVHELRNALQILYGILEQPRVRRPMLHVERSDLVAIEERLERAVKLLEAR